MLNRLEGLFKSLNDRDVRYLVIDGIAAVLHGVPRATFDLDILIEANQANAENLLAALLDAGLGTAALTTADEVLSHEITVFKDVVRVDVQTCTPGLDFRAAWNRRESKAFRSTVLELVCREDLIAAKLASGRKVDIEDARILSSLDMQD